MTKAHLSCCPACGAGVKATSDASDDTYAGWEFDCGAEVIQIESGRLVEESCCGRALLKTLDRLNIVFAGAKPAPGGDAPEAGSAGSRLESLLLELVRMCSVDGIGQTTLKMDDVVVNGENVGAWSIDVHKC